MKLYVEEILSICIKEMSMIITRLRTELDRKKEKAVESDRHNSYLYKKNREQLDEIIELEIKITGYEQVTEVCNNG